MRLHEVSHSGEYLARSRLGWSTASHLGKRSYGPQGGCRRCRGQAAQSGDQSACEARRKAIGHSIPDLLPFAAEVSVCLLRHTSTIVAQPWSGLQLKSHLSVRVRKLLTVASGSFPTHETQHRRERHCPASETFTRFRPFGQK
jgi:hypothetical protein